MSKFLDEIGLAELCSKIKRSLALKQDTIDDIENIRSKANDAYDHAAITSSNPHGTLAKQISIETIEGLTGTEIQTAITSINAKTDDNTRNVSGAIDYIEYDQDSGTFYFYKVGHHTKEEAVFIFDTPIEKVVTNFRFDPDTGKLILTYPDGTEQEIELSSLIKEYEFINTSEIIFTETNHKVSATLATDFKGDLESLVDDAEAAMNNAKSYSDTSSLYGRGLHADGSAIEETDPGYNDNSLYFKNLSKSWAVGGTGLREDEAINNAKYWAEQAKSATEADMEQSVYDPDGSVRLAGGIAAYVDSKESRSVAFGLTLYSALWNEEKKNIIANNEFVVDGYNYIIAPDPTSIDEWMNAEVHAENITNDGYCEFVCNYIPTKNIVVNIIKIKV